MRAVSCARVSFCMQLHQCHNSHERWQQYEAYFLLTFRECLQSTAVVSGGKGHLSVVIEDCFHIASVTRLISAAWHLVSESQKWAIGTCLMAFVVSSNQMASGSSLQFSVVIAILREVILYYMKYDVCLIITEYIEAINLEMLYLITIIHDLQFHSTKLR